MTSKEQEDQWACKGQFCSELAYDLTSLIERRFCNLLKQHFTGNYFKTLNYFSIMYLFENKEEHWLHTAKFDDNQISPAIQYHTKRDGGEFVISVEALFLHNEWSDKKIFSKILPHKTRLAFDRMLDLAEREGELLDRQAAITDFEKAVTEYQAVLPELLKA